MAVKVKPLSEIAEKYATVTPKRSAEYEKGIARTNAAEFESAAKAGEDNFQSAMTDVIAESRRLKGLEGSGAKWKRNAAERGPANFRNSTSKAGPDFEAGFKPYLDVIAGLTLPPKGPAGSPENIDRVAAIAAALHAKKIAT